MAGSEPSTSSRGGGWESARPPAWGCGDLRRVGERKKEDDFAGRVFLFSFTRRVRCKTNRQVGYGRYGLPAAAAAATARWNATGTTTPLVVVLAGSQLCCVLV